jgi:uncharacterized lipoprotein YbaY
MTPRAWALSSVLIVGNVRVLERDKAGALEGVVRLEVANFADAPSRVIASTSISLTPGTEQTRFRLEIDEAPNPKGSYLVTALLEGADVRTRRKRLFGTTVAYPWHPDGASSEVSIEVRPWN